MATNPPADTVHNQGAERNRTEIPVGMNAVEWQTRVDLAAANCIVNHHGWTSQVYNHITARIPGTDELLLREWPACLRLQDRLDP